MMAFPFWPAVFVIFIPFIFLLTVFVIFFIFQSICPSSLEALHNDGPRVIVGGRVARDAGLLGITKEERRMIIENILKPGLFRDLKQETSCIHTDEEKDGEGLMIEGCKTDIVSEKAKAVSSLGTAESCPICFSEFEGDEAVIIGKYCTHLFHSSCLLDWLECHDICPCCRANMMTSDEMREAAFLVFGEKRAYQMLTRDPISGEAEAANST